MTNENQKLVQEMLIKLCQICFMAASPLFPMFVYRAYRLTMKHGVCESTPATFGLVGVLLIAVFGDVATSTMYADQALKLRDRFSHFRDNARVLFITHFQIYSWSRPSSSVVKPLVQTYEIGLKTGDINHAVYAIGTYVIVALMAGRPLVGLLDDCKVYFGQMKELGR